VAEWNKVNGSHLDEGIVVEALEELRVQGWLTDAPSPLADAESAFLTTHGGVRDNREALVRSRVASRVRAEEVDRETMTVDQAAELMGVSASRVRHRLGDGSIYAYPSTGRGVARRIPDWQFHAHRPIPHLASVLAELPDNYRPTEIRDFVFRADVDDPSRDSTIPLLEWLRDGGDPEPARELAAAQHHVI
jgi:excisionase family DNA binding protein